MSDDNLVVTGTARRVRLAMPRDQRRRRGCVVGRFIRGARRRRIRGAHPM